MNENILEFYVNKFSFLNSQDEVDVNFITPILRRKTSLIDKISLSIMNKTYSEKVKSVVFSSRYGEYERLFKIIEQYSQNKEVSPAIFSASVHNYPVGFFLYNIKQPLPYMALSSIKSSISSGLIASITSKYTDILFCYADIIDDKPFSLGLNITKTPDINSKKYILKLRNKENLDDNFNDFINLFENKTNTIETSLFKIERANQ